MSVFLGFERERRRQVYLPERSFRRHWHLIGGTGTGKTTAIISMLLQLFRNRRPAAHFIFDRMGSFSHSLLLWLASPYCPDRVRERVVYIEASREDVFLPFNPLLYSTPAHGYFKVNRATECILRAWASQNIEEMPRLARWVFNAMWAAAQLGLAVADCVHLLMPGSDYHEPLIRLLPPLLQAEWAEILSARGGEAGRILESTRNRMKPYFESPILRRIFGASENRLDALRFMREGKIVIVNLAPQNRLAPQLADAMGGLILNEVLATARSLPMGERYPTYLWLDEFQRFVGPDMEEAIPEVRQLDCRLILSHQTFSQLKRGDTDLTSLIFVCQSRMVLGLQGEDADLMAHELASVTYDPKRVKDEMFSRRQLIADHGLVNLFSWSESEAEAENWNTTYANNWSHQDSQTHSSSNNTTRSRHESASRRDGDWIATRSSGLGNTEGASESDGITSGDSHGGSEQTGKGGSKTKSTSVSVNQSLLPIHDDFMELARRSYYTFEEQRSLLAQQVRTHETGRAFVRIVDDPQVYDVDIQRYAPGHLEWDLDKLARRRPEAIENVSQLVEQNFQSEYFVSAKTIDRQAEERLQRILNPAIKLGRPAIEGESIPRIDMAAETETEYSIGARTLAEDDPMR